MKQILLALIVFLPLSSWAQVPNLDGISDEQLGTVVREFAANFVHTSATPPTSLGKDFGVQAAVIAGVTESPGVDEISKSIDPNAEEIGYIPHAWLLGGVSVPYGVSVELNILPEVDVQGLNMSHVSTGLKWSVTDVLFKSLPFDIAVRTYYSRSKISYGQTVTNPNFPATSDVQVSFENRMYGGDTLFGVDLGVVEPYLGVGYVETKGTLSGVAETETPYSLFDDLSSTSKTVREGSERLIVGTQIHLSMASFGLEYTRVFDVNRFSVKMGLEF